MVDGGVAGFGVLEGVCAGNNGLHFVMAVGVGLGDVGGEVIDTLDLYAFNWEVGGGVGDVAADACDVCLTGDAEEILESELAF